MKCWSVVDTLITVSVSLKSVQWFMWYFDKMTIKHTDFDSRNQKGVLLLDIKNPVIVEWINIKPIILWHILPVSLSSVKGKEQLVCPAGSSNYSYHVISKQLVFWCPHWPLVMSELIIEDEETSMSLVVFMHLSREQKTSSDGCRDYEKSFKLCYLLILVAQSQETVQGHRLFSSLSVSLHAESSCCFPLFSRHFSSSLIALSVSFSTLLSRQCFSLTPLKKAPHLLFSPLRHGGKSLYCLCRFFVFSPLSAYSLRLCQSVFSLTRWKSIHTTCWRHAFKRFGEAWYELMVF